jgi:excisionase family DNA binding protein
MASGVLCSKPERRSVETDPYPWGVTEAARRLQVSEAYVRRLARNGQIPHRRLTPTAPFQFDPAELDAWLESKRVKVPAAS